MKVTPRESERVGDLKRELRGRDNSFKLHSTANRPHPGVHGATAECGGLQAGEEGHRTPGTKGLAGVVGTGSKAKSPGRAEEVFALREVTEINAGTHG